MVLSEDFMLSESNNDPEDEDMWSILLGLYTSEQKSKFDFENLNNDYRNKIIKFQEEKDTADINDLNNLKRLYTFVAGVPDSIEAKKVADIIKYIENKLTGEIK